MSKVSSASLNSARYNYLPVDVVFSLNDVDDPRSRVYDDLVDYASSRYEREFERVATQGNPESEDPAIPN